MSLSIRHKGIYHDRVDAPFIGSLICAIGCHHNCPGCCNEHLKDDDILVSTPEELMKEIKDYRFSEGIIFGGLEWLEQYDELLILLDYATIHGFKLMLYTHYDEEEVSSRFPELYKYKGMYIKYGEYREDLLVHSYSMYGIPLASSNQYIEVVT